MKESRQKSDPGGLPGSKHLAAGTMPSLHSVAEQETTNKRPTASSAREQGTVTDIMTDKINMPLWLQVIASISIPVILALLALVALINPQFAELRTLIIENRDDIAENREAIAALDIKLSGEIAALDNKFSGEIARLDNRITVEVTRLDNKFDALANLMIVAHTNGGATEAELVAIWESVRNPE